MTFPAVQLGPTTGREQVWRDAAPCGAARMSPVQCATRRASSCCSAGERRVPRGVSSPGATSPRVRLPHLRGAPSLAGPGSRGSPAQPPGGVRPQAAPPWKGILAGSPDASLTSHPRKPPAGPRRSAWRRRGPRAAAGGGGEARGGWPRRSPPGAGPGCPRREWAGCPGDP